MAKPTALFKDELVPAKVQSQLPEGYTVRSLQRDDYARGHLEPLRDLTHVGDITEEQWLERFDWMAAREGTYYTIVIVNEAKGNIVATGTLVAEKKLYVSKPPSKTSMIQYLRIDFCKC